VGEAGDGRGSEAAVDCPSFAGHYVLTQGLDDPSGLDLHNYGGRSADSLGPSDATIDIGDDGTITGGSYHVSGDSQGCHYTMNGDTATGNVTQSATGAIIFNGTQTEAGDKRQTTTFATGRPFQFGIAGDELYMCRSNMATVSTCEAAYPRLVAKFVKQS